MNILILHALGDPKQAPRFLKEHVYCLQNNDRKSNYLYHDVALPLPRYVTDIEFDAIILDVSFLAMRWASAQQFKQIKSDYAFIKSSNAVKLAFPQDEYDCNELLDEWMCDWNVDVVVSVISSHHDHLYPTFSRLKRIEFGFTGYLDENLLRHCITPFEERSIDIGYRARKLPPYFGRVGETKWTIGRDVQIAATQAGLRTDIVLGDGGTLFGEDWLNFINDCKFTLGANSGSSLLDPRGEIQRAVRRLLAERPHATFSEIEQACFPGKDGHQQYTAISPRVLEAAVLESCQILVVGDYSGILTPWEHYIPIKPDASDFHEVMEAIRDKQQVSRITKNCKSAILDRQDLRYETAAHKTLKLIEEHVPSRSISRSSTRDRNAIIRYSEEMPSIYARHWAQLRLKNKFIAPLRRYPNILNAGRTARDFIHSFLRQDR